MADDTRTPEELREQSKRTSAFDSIEAALKAGRERSQQQPPAQGIALAAKITKEKQGGQP
jgi:hypothetical protein